MKNLSKALVALSLLITPAMAQKYPNVQMKDVNILGLTCFEAVQRDAAAGDDMTAKLRNWVHIYGEYTGAFATLQEVAISESLRRRNGRWSSVVIKNSITEFKPWSGMSVGKYFIEWCKTQKGNETPTDLALAIYNKYKVKAAITDIKE